jgi:hypothetical protein
MGGILSAATGAAAVTTEPKAIALLAGAWLAYFGALYLKRRL